MRLQRSSKTDFRKSRRRILLILLGVASVAIPAGLTAQVSHTAVVGSDADYLTVGIDVAGADPEILFDNLGDGLSARLEFAIRVLESREGVFVIFGSRMINEFRVVYDLRYDPFRERFTVSTQDGAFFTFRDRATVWSFFFTLPGYRVPWTALDRSGASSGVDLVVETRVVYDPVVFVPGLSILSVLPASPRQQTAWLTTYPEGSR
jgi:hypothetical protein